MKSKQILIITIFLSSISVFFCNKENTKPNDEIIMNEWIALRTINGLTKITEEYTAKIKKAKDVNDILNAIKQYRKKFAEFKPYIIPMLKKYPFSNKYKIPKKIRNAYNRFSDALKRKKEAENLPGNKKLFKDPRVKKALKELDRFKSKRP